MKSTINFKDGKMIVKTGDLTTVYRTAGSESAASETAAGQIALLQQHIYEQREILNKLPKCWRLVAGKLVQDCPVVPGMTVWFWNGFPDCKIEGPEAVRSIDVYEGEFDLNDSCPANWFYDSREAAEAAALERSNDDQPN